MPKRSHSDWTASIAELQQQLNAQPDNLSLAKHLWDSMSGSAGFDVRTGKRAVDTFRRCALKTDEGLTALLNALRTLAEEHSQNPHAELFDPPLENLVRQDARQSNGQLATNAR